MAKTNKLLDILNNQQNSLPGVINIFQNNVISDVINNEKTQLFTPTPTLINGFSNNNTTGNAKTFNEFANTKGVDPKYLYDLGDNSNENTEVNNIFNDNTGVQSDQLDQLSKNNLITPIENSVTGFHHWVLFDNGVVYHSESEDDLFNAKLSAPLNPLDPIVYHDSRNPKRAVVRMVQSYKDPQGKELPTHETETDSTTFTAKNIPVIYLNGHVLEDANIHAMSLVSHHLLPTLDLELVDTLENDKFKIPINTGINNTIVVVIAPATEGKYRTIKMEFYFDDTKKSWDGSKLIISATYKNFAFIQDNLNSTIIKYNPCTDEHCLNPYATNQSDSESESEESETRTLSVKKKSIKRIPNPGDPDYEDYINAYNKYHNKDYTSESEEPETRTLSVRKKSIKRIPNPGDPDYQQLDSSLWNSIDEIDFSKLTPNNVDKMLSEELILKILDIWYYDTWHLENRFRNNVFVMSSYRQLWYYGKAATEKGPIQHFVDRISYFYENKTFEQKGIRDNSIILYTDFMKRYVKKNYNKIQENINNPDVLGEMLEDLVSTLEKMSWEGDKKLARNRIYKTLLKHKKDDRLKTGSPTNNISNSNNSDSKKSNTTSKMNMWQLCHQIAEDCGLGFSAMEQCRDDKDTDFIQVRSRSYKEIIENYQRYLGKTNNDNPTLYDTWIDFYDNLVLVDKFAAMNEEVDASQLGMYAQIGMVMNKDNLLGTEFSLTRRLITNHNMTGVKANIEIDEYWEYDRLPTTSKGTLRHRTIYDPAKGGSVNQVEVGLEEMSPDGRFTEDYTVNKCREWSYGGNGAAQRIKDLMIKKTSEDKFGMHVLTVLLKEPNFALQRGMLINVVIEEFTTREKVNLAKNSAILTDEEAKYKLSPEKNKTVDNISEDDILLDGSIGIVNPTKSGLYYIDGVRFEYIKGERSEGDSDLQERIQQYLILLKRGPFAQLFNHSTVAKFGKSTTSIEMLEDSEKYTDYAMYNVEADAILDDNDNENATEGNLEYVGFDDVEYTTEDGNEITVTENTGNIILHPNGTVSIYGDPEELLDLQEIYDSMNKNETDQIESEE